MPCRENAKVLAADAARVVPKGILLGLILTEGKTTSIDVITKSLLDSFIGLTNIPFTAMIDSKDPQPRVYDWFGVQRDTFLIINLKTMELVEEHAGGGRAKDALAAAEALLTN